MDNRPYNVLFLCTGNSARSILAEAILSKLGHGRFRAFSAGSQPKGKVHPFAIQLLESQGIDPSFARSKSWEEFAEEGAPQMDFIFTVCDSAAGEACPVWPGMPMTAHWGVPDPAAAEGTEAERHLAFAEAWRMLTNRISLFLNLPIETSITCRSRRASMKSAGARTPQSEAPEYKRRTKTMALQDTLRAAPGGIGFFEKWLSVWVALCIVAGIALGNIAPSTVKFLAGLEIASVNLPVALLIWAIVYPMMVNVDFASLRHVGDKPKGLAITVAVNWLIKPFTMAALAVLFFEYLFAPLIAPADAQQYIAGLILLGAAPCTAMVFVWSQLTRGDPTYTLVQVSVNDLIMVFAFAPIVAILLGVTDLVVPWETLLLSVGLYVVIPLLAGMATRQWLTRQAAPGAGEAAVTDFTARIKPVSVIGLLATVVILFAFQGNVILENPLVIALIAVPLLIQSYGIFFVAYAAAKAWKVPFNIAAPCALIGTSNFFELAVAVAIGLFGLNSGAALATVVGVLVEVPVMLSLVAFANRTRHWFPKNGEAR